MGGCQIRIQGSPVLKSIVHKTEKLKCNLCGKIFEAEYEGKSADKYDAGAHAVVAILKYGASVPFYRLEKNQKQFSGY